MKIADSALLGLFMRDNAKCIVVIDPKGPEKI